MHFDDVLTIVCNLGMAGNIIVGGSYRITGIALSSVKVTQMHLLLMVFRYYYTWICWYDW